MTIHLNGWRRLWLVVVVIYAAVVGVFAYVGTPTPNDVPSSTILIDRLPAEYRDLLKGFIPDDGLQAEFPNGHVLKFRQGVTKSQVSSVAKAYAAVFTDALDAKRREFALLILAAWLFPSVALYGLGEGVAWVRRGFKHAP
jgi:hypothetical protein